MKAALGKIYLLAALLLVGLPAAAMAGPATPPVAYASRGGTAKHGKVPQMTRLRGQSRHPIEVVRRNIPSHL